MTKEYNHVGISGKFRMLHQAHVELLIRAINISENVHIFIVDVPKYVRFSTVPELKKAFEILLKQLAFTNYEIHIINEELDSLSWDKKVLELVPKMEVMIDSKESYGNQLVGNKYIKLNHSLNISVSSIENDVYEFDKYQQISNAFKPFVNRIVPIIDSADNLQLLAKLALFYSAEYQYFVVENSPNIFQKLLLNLPSSQRFLFTNIDPIYFLYLFNRSEIEITKLIELKSKFTASVLFNDVDVKLLELYDKYNWNYTLIERKSTVDDQFMNYIDIVNAQFKIEI
jgi:hypothetical protein